MRENKNVYLLNLCRFGTNAISDFREKDDFRPASTIIIYNPTRKKSKNFFLYPTDHFNKVPPHETEISFRRKLCPEGAVYTDEYCDYIYL